MSNRTKIEDDEAGLRRSDIASLLADEAAASLTPEALVGRARSLAERIADEEARRAGGTGIGTGDAPLPAGFLLGPWEVQALVGEGGQARVYRARHRTMERLAAVKVPRSAAANRLVKEARLAARIEHSRIVRVLDVVVDHAPPYLVLEWCPGGSLADRLAATPGQGLPLDQVGRIADDVLLALTVAHEAGVVHCDVKPANILFDQEGAATLGDLGIGRAPADGAARLANTAAGTGALTAVAGAGTPLYLAPEQERPALLAGAPIDGRADLFALGKVIFEMLTGASPRTVRPPSRLRKDLDPRWDEVIFRLLEEKREARFATAQEARRELGKFALRELRDPVLRKLVAEDGKERVVAREKVPSIEWLGRLFDAQGTSAEGGSGRSLGWSLGGALGMLFLVAVVALAFGLRQMLVGGSLGDGSGDVTYSQVVGAASYAILILGASGVLGLVWGLVGLARRVIARVRERREEEKRARRGVRR